MTPEERGVLGPERSARWPSEVVVPGLHAPTLITRGRRGVPLVRGETLPDAICGLGYVTGRDRTFQLDLARRQAAGRLAELLGVSFVDRDVVQRRLGMQQLAEAAAAHLPSDQFELAQAYTVGVNEAFAESGPPLELRLLGRAEVAPWTVADTMLTVLLLVQALSGDGRDRRSRAVMEETLPGDVVDFLTSEADPYLVDLSGRPVEPRQVSVPVESVRKLLAAAPGRPSGRLVVTEDESPWGSNAFVIAGEHTADGRAVLANDMHLPLVAPALFYQAGLSWGAGQRVEGLVIPGVPVFVAGTTKTLAWGATRFLADTVDLVEAVPDASDPAFYLGSDGVRKLTVRRERIDVRDGEPVLAEFTESEWGPLLAAKLAGRPLARHWTALEPGGIDLGLGSLLTAPDVEHAREVARSAGGPPLNVLFADSAGHIGWAVSGKYPARAANASRGVVHLTRAEATWSDLVAPDQLPALLDPAGGVLISANNRLPEHRTTPPIAPDAFGGRRATRIAELLTIAMPTEQGLLAVQLDQNAEFYRFYQQIALEVLTADVLSGHPGRRSLRDGLMAWDGSATPEARGLAVLSLFRELVRETWFGALLGPCLTFDETFHYTWHSHEAALRALLSCPDLDLVPAPYRDRSALLLAELDLCAIMLRRLAPDTDPGDIRWGQLGPAGIRHPLSGLFPDLAPLLDLPSDAPGGCSESVCATRPGFGPAMRLVVSPGRFDEALIHLPGGQSGHPGDATYRDGFQAWLKGAPEPLLDLPERSRTWLLPPEPSHPDRTIAPSRRS